VKNNLSEQNFVKKKLPQASFSFLETHTLVNILFYF
jgi:hypothetical protein